jgi:hypothetical protein
MRYTSKDIPDNIKRMMSDTDKQDLGLSAPIKAVPDAVIEKMRDNYEVLESEKDLQNLICNYLRQHGIIFGWSRMNVKSTYTEGWPDFSFQWKQRAIYLEAKVGRNGLSEAQETVRAALVTGGAEYYVVRHLEEVKRILEGAK